MGQLKRLRTENIVKVIYALYMKGPSTKKMLSTHLGFSISLTTSICNDLVKKRVIFEVESVKNNKVGRREILLDINFDRKFLIGITILEDVTEIIVTNLEPKILYRQSIITLRDNVDELLANIIGIIDSFIARENHNNSEFMGIGIGIKGGMNFETGLVDKDLWYEGINIIDKFEALTNIPVFIQNITNNLAMAECFYGQNDRDFVLIRHGIGVGGAIFLDGRIMTNDKGTIGKIGHMLINRKGDYCLICKRRGCLESLVSFNHLAVLVKEHLHTHELSALNKQLDGNIENLTPELLFDAYRKGSVVLSNLLKDCAMYFAHAIISSYSVLGVSDYILHGNFFEQKEFFRMIEFYLYEMQCYVGEPTISVSLLDEEKTQISSVMLVLYRTLFNNDSGEYWRRIRTSTPM